MASPKNGLIYQFKITLLDISPRIWRRIQVPEHYTFWDLHVAVQDSMGWLDCHLHAFRFQKSDGKRAVEIGIPDEEDQHNLTLPGWEVGIADYFIRPGVAALYEYDFGDGWAHGILLESVLLGEPKVKYPKCIDGERACPPEDSGGIGGYYRLLKILGNPNHREHADSVAWLKGHAGNYHPYDPARFEPEAVRFTNPKRRWEKAFAKTG